MLDLPLEFEEIAKLTLTVLFVLPGSMSVQYGPAPANSKMRGSRRKGKSGIRLIEEAQNIRQIIILNFYSIPQQSRIDKLRQMTMRLR